MGNESSGTDDKPAQPTHDERWQYETDTTGDLHVTSDFGEVHIQQHAEGSIETFSVVGTRVPLAVRVGDSRDDGDYIAATAQLTADQCERLARDLEEQAAAAREAEVAEDA